MEELIPFNDRLKGILKKRKISIVQFCIDTGIDRPGFFDKKGHKHRKIYYMGIAYYLNMTVEDLVDGTDAMDILYG